MKTTMHTISRLKKADAAIQVISFLASLIATCVCFQYAIYYVLSFAGIQVLSCLAWSLFFLGETPRMGPGTMIRRMFLVILGITAITAAIAPEYVLLIGMVMLLPGPVCGFIYFATTVAEVRFYREQKFTESR